VAAALQAKGFRLREGDHHFFIYFNLTGLKTQVFTKTSHHEKQICEGLLSLMAKQCRLTNKLFGNLLDCPLDQLGYETELRRQGFLR
jgi:hypothetical protein